MTRRIFYILCLLIGFQWSIAYAQTQPASGTQIINQATTTFSNNARQSGTITSNKVVVSVRPAEQVLLWNDDHFDYAQSGTNVVFTHTLKNIGNIKSDVHLTISNKQNDDIDTENITFLAQNKSTTPTNPVALDVALTPGEAYQFSYQVHVPQNARAGQMAKLAIQANTKLQQISISNTDSIEVVGGPELSISKTASPNNVKQGDLLNYTLNGQNTGDMIAAPMSVTLDGQDKHFVLVRDKMPPNTSFSNYTSAGSGTKLFHLRGEPEHTYQSNPPQNPGDVDAIAAGYDSLDIGESFSMKFSVIINQNASGQLKNTAQAYFLDQSSAKIQRVVAKSNKVVTNLPEKNATLSFFTDDNYNHKTNTGAIGEPLYIQADAAICNDDIEMVDTTKIQIDASKTNDSEIYTGIETGPNTGYFRILPYVDTRDANDYPVVKGNKIMDIVEDDNLIAKMPECGVQAKALVANASISPYGIVFNSQTNEPVQGATVRLIDVTGQSNGGHAGEPAYVYNYRGNKRISAEQITGEKGKFNFPYLNAGTYRIEVITPKQYAYPSAARPSSISFDRTLDSLASYHKQFTIDKSATAVDEDIPLDPQTNGVLITKKEADRSQMQVGDFITYKVTVTSKADFELPDVHVEDALPFGFKYQKKSAHLNNKSLDDPEGGVGPQLSFSLGTLKPGDSDILTYRVQAGPGSKNSDGKNTAIAVSNGPLHITSNKAVHKVKLNEGVFTDKGYIIGKVFMDVNKNKIQDPGEHGVPGVRLFLENGLFVITDSEGKYSFYGIRPRKHVLKLDNYSLPKGSSLEILDNQHANDPSSRFVSLTNGEMQRADFAICLSDSALARELKARRNAMAPKEDEVGATLKHHLRATPENSGSNGRREDASGTIGNNEVPDMKKEKTPGTSKAEQPDSAAHTASTQPHRDPKALEKAMIHVDNELGFIKLSDNDTLHVPQTDVWIKGPTGAKLSLTLNGEPVSPNRISKKSKLAPRKLEAYEYIGIKLQPGKNTLSVSAKDPFGNDRGKKQIKIFAPGTMRTIRITPLDKDVPADGNSTARFNLTALDARGISLDVSLPVTLKASGGELLIKDMDPKKPGTQTLIKGTHNNITLKAPDSPQKVRVTATLGTQDFYNDLTFIPNLRPLMAAGIIEGTIRLNGSAKVVPASSADNFERELKTLSYRTGNMTADARAAFYLKGKIKGNYLLTARVNTEKEEDKQLFRDIEPDKFYPVYGESSVKGYDAQSAGRFYVRIDKNQTYALYGDFITQKRDPAKSLGEYSRILTGVKSHYESSHVSLTAYGSQASSLRKVEEIRGLGVSGPYTLKSQNIVPNSEKVEIITRDRNQPSVIIDEKVLARYTDYTLEPFTGNLLFRMPISSMDKNLNPEYIRVTYEVYDNGNQYLIGGVDGQYAFSRDFKVGGSYVNDQNPENNYELKSLNSTIKFSPDTRLITEIAKSTTDLSGSGIGKRLEFQFQRDNADLLIYGGNADRDFQNRTARYQPGTTEAGARGHINLTSKSSLRGEMLYSNIDTTGNRTVGFLMNYDHDINKYIQLELGVRHSRQQVGQQTNNGKQNFTNTNVRSKITTEIPGVEGASVSGEYEQDIRDIDRKVVAVGGDYNIPHNGKIYARHEFISSALGRYTLRNDQRRQNTVFGIDADYMKDGKVYSEYRVDDALDGRNGQAAIGLRNKFKIRDGFTVNAGLERVFSVTGDPLNEGTSISGALAYTANPLWKATARMEARFSKNGNMYLNTLGYGRKINKDWTFLGKNIFAMTTSSNANTQDKIQERARLGLAFRETQRNRWSGLSRYELRYEQNGQYGSDFNRLVHIFSTHINYHPTSDWALTAHLAAKKVGETYDQLESKSVTTLYSTKGTYDINNWLDAGLKASMLSNANLIDRQYGLGTELGFIARRNLRIAVGYNVFGFEDRDLTESNYTQQGAYVGMSYKFDERLFKGLMPDQQQQHPEIYAICRACNIYHNAKTLPYTKVEIPELPIGTFSARSIAYHNLGFIPRGIHFGFDQYTINDEAANMLDRIAHYLMKEKNQSLKIMGYTDIKGSYSYNLKLSNKRALAAKSYLIAAGIQPGQILNAEGLSYGDSTGKSASAFVSRAQNRVVYIDSKKEYDPSIRLISQINDLQIEHQLSQSSQPWTYIFDPSFQAVPDRIHFQSGSDSLSSVTQYMLTRTLRVLKRHPEIQVQFNIAAKNTAVQSLFKNRKDVLNTYLISHGLNAQRFTIHSKKSTSGGNQTVWISYKPTADLKIVKTHDDLKFNDNPYILNAIADMKQAITTRKDSLLFYPDVQTGQLPGKILVRSSHLPFVPITAGILSRIGSYLHDHTSEILTLIPSDENGNAKADLVKKYLVQWGIDSSRIIISSDSISHEKMKQNWVHLKYSTSQSDIEIDTRIEALYKKMEK